MCTERETLVTRMVAETNQLGTQIKLNGKRKQLLVLCSQDTFSPCDIKIPGLVALRLLGHVGVSQSDSHAFGLSLSIIFLLKTGEAEMDTYVSTQGCLPYAGRRNHGPPL